MGCPGLSCLQTASYKSKPASLSEAKSSLPTDLLAPGSFFGLARREPSACPALPIPTQTAQPSWAGADEYFSYLDRFIHLLQSLLHVPHRGWLAVGFWWGENTAFSQAGGGQQGLRLLLFHERSYGDKSDERTGEPVWSPDSPNQGSYFLSLSLSFPFREGTKNCTLGSGQILQVDLGSPTGLTLDPQLLSTPPCRHPCQPT